MCARKWEASAAVVGPGSSGFSEEPSLVFSVCSCMCSLLLGMGSAQP